MTEQRKQALQVTGKGLQSNPMGRLLGNPQSTDSLNLETVGLHINRSSRETQRAAIQTDRLLLKIAVEDSGCTAKHNGPSTMDDNELTRVHNAATCARRSQARSGRRTGIDGYSKKPPADSSLSESHHSGTACLPVNDSGKLARNRYLWLWIYCLLFQRGFEPMALLHQIGVGIPGHI